MKLQTVPVRLCALTLLLSALLLTSACATAPPSDPSNWRACLVQPMAMRVDGDSVAVGGSRQVFLYAQWGLPANSPGADFGSLLVQIPETLRVNQPVAIISDPDSKAHYKAGRDYLDYDAETIAGTVKLTNVGRRTLTVELDLLASDPILDTEGRGDVPLKGEVEMELVSSIRDCY